MKPVNMLITAPEHSGRGVVRELAGTPCFDARTKPRARRNLRSLMLETPRRPVANPVCMSVYACVYVYEYVHRRQNTPKSPTPRSQAFLYGFCLLRWHLPEGQKPPCGTPTRRRPLQHSRRPGTSSPPPPERKSENMRIRVRREAGCPGFKSSRTALPEGSWYPFLCKGYTSLALSSCLALPVQGSPRICFPNFDVLQKASDSTFSL